MDDADTRADTRPLFAYGTLQHPPLLDVLLGRRPRSQPAEIRGFRAAPLRDRHHPGLVRERGARAGGLLVHIEADELATLDAFEGPAYRRARVRVHLPMLGEPAVEAQTFLLADPEAGIVLPGVWSLDEFVAEHAGEWVAGARTGSHHPAK